MSESNNNFDCAVCGLTNKDFKFYGIGICNHPICGVCAIKLAKFSKDSDNLYDYSKCVICKQHMSKIVISPEIKSFEQFNQNSMLSLKQYGLLFDGPIAQKFYQDIVRVQCKKCSREFDSINELVEHVELHNLRYCTLCVEFDKCLPSEFVLMTDNDFHYHNTKQHPKCPFCKKRYYDDSQLIKHAKESHFLCDICNRRQGFVAYNTQVELLKHYINDHHVCEICRSAAVINVFDSEYHLKTHKVLEHDNKGLVSEGLMNVNYGDRDARYGARRRGRDNNEGALFEEGNAANATDQPLPAMECEQEFPPLNADVPQPNRQLGMKSVTNDDNDARGAFVKKNNHQEETKKPMAPQMPKNKEVMSASVAYSNKKSIGNLNENDFPSLSSDIKVQSHQSLEYKNMQSNKESNAPKKKILSDEDFPGLSGKSVKASTATPQWKPTMKSTPSSHVPKTVVANKVHVHSAPRAREESPDHCPEVDMEYEREMAYKPKIQYMSHDEFKQNSTKNTVMNHSLPPPQESDFPVLGNSKNTSAATSRTAVGAWGEYNVQTQKPKAKPQKSVIRDNFTANSPLDFPELPFKTKPVENVSSNQKQKNKQKKKDNFAGAAASSNGVIPQSKVYSLKGVSEHFQREVSLKAEPAPCYDTSDSIYTHRPTLSSSSAMRGLDYVPYVVPTNENVVFVDSKVFADLKNPKAKDTANERQLSYNYENDFPTNDGHSTAPSASTNHFSVLQDTTLSSEMLEREKKPTPKVEVKFVPKLSSNADFPSLGPRKPSAPPADKPQRTKPKKEATKARMDEAGVPAMSLADIALSVTNKNYTAFSDADARNQHLFETVHAALDPQLATRFLSLSSQYRNRKITVQVYLDSIEDAFSDKSDFISELLPQMLVLLPDISLQKCLFSHMTKQWTVGLRECLKCGQMLNKADGDVHDAVAHR